MPDPNADDGTQKPIDPDAIVIPRDVERPAGEGGAEAAPADETPDYVFRLQVALTNFTAKNGRFMAGLAGAGLAGVLVWGLWNVWTERSAAAEFGAIAAIDYRMPKLCPAGSHEETGFCFSDENSRSLTGVAGDDLSDAGRKADLEEGARRFEAAAKDASGSAAVYGYLKAADAWRRAGNKDSQVAALKSAYAVGGGDMPGWTAGNAYATALIDAGKSDEALGVYRQLAGKTQGFYAQEALLTLASAQIDLGKNDDAKQTLTEFKTRFPAAPTDKANALEARAGGAPLEPPKPADGATPPAQPAPAGSAG